MSTTETIVTIAVAIIGSGLFNKILDVVSEKKNKTDGVQKAARLLMKTQLRSLCMTYIEQGWIYQDELEDIIAMHGVYHDDLKGNGFLDEMMERVRDLDIRGIGVK